MVDSVRKILRREMLADDENRQDDAETFEAVRKEIERLRRERDEWKSMATEFKGLTEEWQGKAEQAEREQDSAVKALEPFAKIAEAILSEAPPNADWYSLFMDCQGVSHRVSMDELRSARHHRPRQAGGWE